jgi:hypothetical protein
LDVGLSSIDTLLAWSCAATSDETMLKHPLRAAAQVAMTVAIGMVGSMAHGQVYKCTDATGKTTYADAPCDAGTKPLKLPEDPKASTINPATNPSMCAQLLDETRRLKADAERSAKQGRSESADSVKRRQTLDARYHARCAGITRSEPKPGS